MAPRLTNRSEKRKNATEREKARMEKKILVYGFWTFFCLYVHIIVLEILRMGTFLIFSKTRFEDWKTRFSVKKCETCGMKFSARDSRIFKKIFFLSYL